MRLSIVLCDRGFTSVPPLVVTSSIAADRRLEAPPARSAGIEVEKAAYWPCIRPRDGESNNEFDCKFGPGLLESRGKPVQAFSSPICAEAKVEFRQCLNGTMLGSYQYPNCQ
jgi:hypothetical protein